MYNVFDGEITWRCVVVEDNGVKLVTRVVMMRSKKATASKLVFLVFLFIMLIIDLDVSTFLSFFNLFLCFSGSNDYLRII